MHVYVVGRHRWRGLSIGVCGKELWRLWENDLKKKNEFVDSADAEALEAFKHSARDEWLARHLGQEKPKSMVALTALMTRTTGHSQKQQHQ